MLATGRFEGHIVLGHVEGVGRVVSTLGTSSTISPTPNPSPWPFVALATHGRQGEGNSALTQFNRLRDRVWKGLGESKRSPHVLVERARGMRRLPTDAEKKLWERLRSNKVDDIRFRRQHPIGPYILDFYSDTLKLAIEIDGRIHDDAGQKEYENHRTINLNSRGISVMRFSNEDILNRMDNVLNAIIDFSRAPLTQLPAGLGEGQGVGANHQDTSTCEVEAEALRGGTSTEGVGANQKDVGTHYSEVNGESLLTIELPSDLLPFVVLHGCIMIDGVALTVASLHASEVTIAIIPHTLNITTLSLLKKGDAVNIETDILAKYVLQKS